MHKPFNSNSAVSGRSRRLTLNLPLAHSLYTGTSIYRASSASRGPQDLRTRGRYLVSAQTKSSIRKERIHIPAKPLSTSFGSRCVYTYASGECEKPLCGRYARYIGSSRRGLQEGLDVSIRGRSLPVLFRVWRIIPQACGYRGAVFCLIFCALFIYSPRECEKICEDVFCAGSASNF